MTNYSLIYSYTILVITAEYLSNFPTVPTPHNFKNLNKRKKHNSHSKDLILVLNWIIWNIYKAWYNISRFFLIWCHQHTLLEKFTATTQWPSLRFRPTNNILTVENGSEKPAKPTNETMMGMVEPNFAEHMKPIVFGSIGPLGLWATQNPSNPISLM